MSSYIGGTGNYIAVSESLGVSSSIMAAGFATDNVICAIYVTSLFALASDIPSEASTSPNDGQMVTEPNPSNKFPLLETATAIATSMAICRVATYLTKLFGMKGGTIQFTTAIVVILATIFPTKFLYLAPAGESVALILMQVFFAAMGAGGSVLNVVKTAPSIFTFALLQVAIHLTVVLGLGKLLELEKRMLLLASNANMGSPTTACAMAMTKGWGSLIVPGILVGYWEDR